MVLPLFSRWWWVLSGLLLAGVVPTRAQTADTLRQQPGAPAAATSDEDRRDLGDVLTYFFPRLRPAARDTTVTLESGHRFVSIIPVVSYTLQTRGLLQVAGNVAYQKPGANISTLVSALAVTQNKQVILTATSSIWTPDNRINWIGDWRLMHYPQNTYGLGTRTSTRRGVVNMEFDYLRIYQTMLRRILPNFYGGLGYQLDYHWGIESTSYGQEVARISGYEQGITGSSVSSGVALNLLYDSRGNAINPQPGGAYVNLLYRPNLKLLGSTVTYQTLLLEARRYLRLREGSGNMLALWSYNSITLQGTPPYLDLPSTGWDTYNNTGRGFIQGRFRGKDMLYAEAEYRFRITRNRLLGGVAFGNAQTISEPATNQFEKVVPAVGVGLRVAMNKLSRTNLSIDYGFGFDGSRALSFNVGEVF
ncbi:BamA/TamA family outer membrane protein [Hymenobacter defluvii]|uniref:BamA/TamA family outer membrane protein n=1 Tax=Hymenobacter defluvii TaxID=2054411 RepID=A0ABS3TDH0_9BACT|nr:BamA/TamA family outer membrane protein [Hymenobacter defluvii]MBO3271228.1 BamA/TamA family outer membrane protein [Hymenobacter defluvii]